jgi:3-oxoacyl-[acyl-carrier-protein] synthase-3
MFIIWPSFSERFSCQGEREHIMSQVCIRGVGGYVPPGRRSNWELAAKFGVTEESIVKLTGIHERRLAAPEQATSDMALLAAQALLLMLALPQGGRLSLIATASADHITPSTANLVQHRLGLRPCRHMASTLAAPASMLITGAG